MPSPVIPGPAAKTPEPGALALQLLRPIDALMLPAGQSSRAEVINSKTDGAQFEVLLRLSQSNTQGKTLDITATSPRALATGTQLVIQALNPMQLMAILQPADKPTADLLTRLDPALFPPGSKVEARVISQQQISAAGEQLRFAILARLLQGPASGSTLNLTSGKALEPGTLLSAEVGTRGELRVADMAKQQMAMALSLGLRDSMQRQASAEPLLSSIDLLNRSSATLPEGVQAAMRQVLQQVVNISQLTSSTGVQQAIQRSGSFLEAGLKQLTEMLTTGNPAGNPAPGNRTDVTAQPAQVQTGSLPALDKLITLLSSLPVSADSPSLPGADLKAALVNLLINLQQQLPPGTLKLLGLQPGPWQQGMSAVPHGIFPLPARAMQALTDAPDLGALLRLTAALLSRIQHHQLQSLGQTQSFSDGSSQTTWQLEIPLRDGQQFSHVQVRIQRDDAPAKGKKQEQEPLWEVRLAFNLDQLGALQAIARLFKGRVSTEFWAEQQSTLSLLDQELVQLRDRLLAKGLEVGEMSCHRGAPPQPSHAVQQRWIDEVT